MAKSNGVIIEHLMNNYVQKCEKESERESGTRVGTVATPVSQGPGKPEEKSLEPT
jgi:hypothetical protein